MKNLPVGTRRSHTAILAALAASLLACTPASRPAPGAPPKPPSARATRVTDAALAAQLRREGGSRVASEGASLLGIDGATVIRVPPSNLVRVTSKGQLIGPDGGSLIGPDGGTLIGVDGGSLIGPDGGTLIGPDGGTLIGPDGGSLIGPDGGTLIGVDGGSLTGRVELPAGLVGPRAGYSLASTAPAAGVRVYVRDARGRFFVGADGKLVSAVTNQDGLVTFPGYKVARGLSLHVPLDATDGVLRGFSGLRPRTQPAGVPVPVTPTATLLAGWVETQVLASQPDPAAALDRLTPEAAQQAHEAARDAFTAEALAGSAWRPDRLADAANAAGEKHQALAAALQEVRRVMTLAGVAGCEDGRMAREVALRLPIGIAVGSTGDLFVSSHMTAGIGRLDPRDGRMYYVLGPCKDKTVTVPPFDKLVKGSGNWIWASSLAGRGVFRFRADDPRPERWAGGGEERPAVGLAATSCRFDEVKAVAEEGDGRVHFIATIRALKDGVDHLVTTDAKGTLTALEERPAHGVALAATPDGALWLLENGGVLFRRAPGGAFQPALAAKLFNVNIRFTDMLAMPDNSVLITLSREDAGTLWQGVKRVRPGATAPEPFLGSGELGYDEGPVAALQARLSRPAGLARDGRGRVLVADYGNGVIRSYDPATGLFETVAGRREDKEVVAADAVLDLPAGICYDATGQLVVTEVGSNTVRQLQAGRLKRIAGGLGGFAADSAVADRLDGPLLVARGARGLLLVENKDHLVRELLPGAVPGTFTLRTVAGGSQNIHSPSELPLRATDANWSDLTALTTDAAGRPVFAAALAGTKTACVWRVEPDGALTKLAGVPLGDAKALVLSHPSDREGQLAGAVGLGFVTGLAYDAAGRLCFSEVDHGLVWRVEPDGTLHRLAGRGQGDTLVFLAEPDAEARARAEGDLPGQDAVLLSPIGLAADAKGNVYVAEAGTRGLALFSELLNFAALPLDLTLLAQLDGRVRRLAPDGTAHTLAGLGGPPGTEGIRNPIALALSPDGQLALVDLGAGQVKLLTNP